MTVFCMRSAGSKGKVDIAVFQKEPSWLEPGPHKRGRVLLIQCKLQYKLADRAERAQLGLIRKKTGHPTYMAYRQEGRIVLQEIAVDGSSIGKPMKLRRST
jgi:hypothetical protein